MVIMNFTTQWCKWILECVTTATSSVFVNGSPTEEFKLVIWKERNECIFQRKEEDLQIVCEKN